MSTLKATGPRTGSHSTDVQLDDRTPDIDPDQACREAWRRVAAGFAVAFEAPGLSPDDQATFQRCQRFAEQQAVAA